MTNAVDIHITDAAITAVLVGGDWTDVTGVLISYADYTAAGVTVTGHDLHLAATIHGGPNNGKRLVCPLAAIAAFRV